MGALDMREFWPSQGDGSELPRSREQLEEARREAMRAMSEALAAARAAHRAREEFLARMSHELRTPLNAVIGFSRVLEKNRAGNQRPEDIELLARVRKGGEQLLRLVEDVLDQSKIERGQMTVALEDVDVAAIATRVVRRFRHRAMSKGLRLIDAIPQSAPSVRVDAARFEQVLEHLLDNAIKFTVGGSIRVTLVTDAATKVPSRLVVSDTGIGIAQDEIERIFEPFSQVESSPSRSYGGAGLGLPLARQLCDAMGCELRVESQVGIGSRFAIRFPNPD